MFADLSRRGLLFGGLGAAATVTLSACGSSPARPSTAASPALPSASPAQPTPGQKTLTAQLTPRQVTLDLGDGVTAKTWAYSDSSEGQLIRATAGDLLRISVDNRLPTDTTVHWHGIHLRNAADGVPGVTQKPIATGSSYLYEFIAPNPGTHFYHPHVGVQLDRGLYGPIIVDDPHESGAYDAEWIVVLDDWTDGVGKSPDDILAGYKAQSGTLSGDMGSGGRGGMGGMGGSSSSPLGDAGDIAYPHYLINGRVPTAPRTFAAKKSQRVRIRFINAGSDTVFQVALGGHRLTITHTDGYPVQPRDTDSFYISMGERFDATVTLGDGVFPLVAAPVSKDGRPGWALVRTGSGAAPKVGTSVNQFSGNALLATDLRPLDSAKLPDKSIDKTIPVTLNGQMQPYAWGLNGQRFPNADPLTLREGQRVRMQMTNMTMMVHPMHIHGHSWSLPNSGGLRKDTVLVLPMQTVVADLQADNPGDWMYHCHNIYHAELGMMTRLQYT